MSVETFATRPSQDAWLAGYAAASALAALLTYASPLVTTIAGIVAVVLHARDSDGRAVWVRRSLEDANVVARAPDARRPALVMAASLHAKPSAPRGLVVTLHTLMLAVPAAGAAAWIAEPGTELPGRLDVAAVVIAVAIVVVALTLYRPRAGDGATTTAAEVLTALAPRLRDRDVWLVVLGREGVPALLATHGDELAGATWLGLEPSTGEAVVAVSEEGPWRERRADRWLLDAAEEAGAEVRPHRVATAITPLLARKRRGLSLLVSVDGAEDVVVATAIAAVSRGATKGLG